MTTRRCLTFATNVQLTLPRGQPLLTPSMEECSSRATTDAMSSSLRTLKGADHRLDGLTSYVGTLRFGWPGLEPGDTSFLVGSYEMISPPAHVVLDELSGLPLRGNELWVGYVEADLIYIRAGSRFAFDLHLDADEQLIISDERASDARVAPHHVRFLVQFAHGSNLSGFAGVDEPGDKRPAISRPRAPAT